jgi:hypothetical protein
MPAVRRNRGKDIQVKELKRMQAKTTIKRLILRNPGISVDELNQEITKRGIRISRLTLSEIRRSFLSDLKFLAAEGYLPEAYAELRRNTNTPV